MSNQGNCAWDPSHAVFFFFFFFQLPHISFHHSTPSRFHLFKTTLCVWHGSWSSLDICDWSVTNGLVCGLHAECLYSVFPLPCAHKTFIFLVVNHQLSGPKGELSQWCSLPPLAASNTIIFSFALALKSRAILFHHNSLHRTLIPWPCNLYIHPHSDGGWSAGWYYGWMELGR